MGISHFCAHKKFRLSWLMSARSLLLRGNKIADVGYEQRYNGIHNVQRMQRYDILESGHRVPCQCMLMSRRGKTEWLPSVDQGAVVACKGPEANAGHHLPRPVDI